MLNLAKGEKVKIDCIDFIQTKSLVDDAMMLKIQHLFSENPIIAFTSAKAVEVAGKLFYGQSPVAIYCLGNATRKAVEKIFEVSSVRGVAENASGLAEQIIKTGVMSVTFFCGNQRRDTLPDKVRAAGIKVEELVVYETVELPLKVTDHYDAILFYSPSGVRSFFEQNNHETGTIYFAIGTTTAEALNQFSCANIMVSPKPSKSAMLLQVLDYFNILAN